jgi:pre-mRNA-splicing helicase BRR2
MLRDPALYSVGIDYQEDDKGLVQKRADIIHTAAALLEKCSLVKYERASGRFQSTELGRIASHYYVTYNSMATYNKHLRPSMNMLELFRVFALSNEFKYIPVRHY